MIRRLCESLTVWLDAAAIWQICRGKFSAWLFQWPRVEFCPKGRTPMKISKNLAFLLVGVLIILLYSNCAKKGTSFVEAVSDGYIITADEESFKNVKDDTDYAITFVDVGEGKSANRDVIKAALSDSSKVSSLEGKAKKVGANQVKISTNSKLTIDLN